MDWHDDIPVSGTVHLPPTPEALRHIQEASDLENARKVTEQIGREYDNDRERATHLTAFGMGHPQALKQHMIDHHYLWPEDADGMEHPATSHMRWHTNREFGGEEHSH